MSTRFGVLGYTSVDTASGPGGYQVTEALGGLTQEETDALVRRVTARGLDRYPLPQYPTPEEIAGAARRFSYGRSLGGWALWHVAPAGLDATRRPGNSFAHVVLDREPTTAADGVRPIELWRSPDWLTPFNPDQVRAARLPGATRPAPSGGLSRDVVVRRLLGAEAWRLSLLPVLLDAVEAAMAGGPPVVLGTADVDSAALWAAAVSHLMPPVAARRLGLSLLETVPVGGGDEVGAQAREAGWHLICVPHEDVSRAGSGVVALDDREVPAMGEPGRSPHQVGDATVPAGRWPLLAMDALQDEETALMTLGAADRFATDVSDPDLPVAWALAAVMIRENELFADVAEEAAEILLAYRPLQAPPWLDGVVDTVVAQHAGVSTQDAWRFTAGLPAASPLAVPAAAVYVTRAVQDPAWLASTEVVPAPPVALGLAAESVLELLEHLDRRESATLHSAWQVEVLRALGLLAASGALDQPFVRGRAEELARVAFLDDLLDPAAAPELLGRAGSAGDQLVQLVLGPIEDRLRRHGREGQARLGALLPEATLAWLGGGHALHADGPDPVAEARALGLVDREVVVRRAADELRDGRPLTAPVTVFCLLVADRAAGGAPIVAPEQLAVQVPAPVVVALVERFGSAVPVTSVLRPLLADPRDDSWEQLAGLVIEAGRLVEDTSPWRRAEDAAAWRRRLDGDWWDQTRTRVVSYLPDGSASGARPLGLAAEGLRLLSSVRDDLASVDREVVARTQAAIVLTYLTTVNGAQLAVPGVHAIFRETLADEAADTLVGIVLEGADEDVVLAAWLAAAPEPPRERPDIPEWDQLARLCVSTQRGVVPLMEHAATLIVGGRSGDELKDLAWAASGVLAREHARGPVPGADAGGWSARPAVGSRSALLTPDQRMELSSWCLRRLNALAPRGAARFISRLVRRTNG